MLTRPLEHFGGHWPSHRRFVLNTGRHCLLHAGIILFTLTACSAPSGNGTGTGGADSGGAEPGGLVSVGDVDLSDPDGDVAATEDTPEPTTCGSLNIEADAARLPMDIIIAIDNSGSMNEEIAAVERNINQNFADIIEASGVDYRVMLFTGYRPQQAGRVCVDAPLGPEPPCEDRTEQDSPHREGRLIHFNQLLGSDNLWCRLEQDISSAPGFQDEPDPLLDQGWLPLLRQEAEKVFLVISDDRISCGNGQFEGGPVFQNYAVADRPDYVPGAFDDAVAAFDEWLLAAAPEQFGTADNRRYTYHSIVGVAEKGLAAYEPTEPIVTEKCDSAENVGEAHQLLSILTGGLRYPVCGHDSYDAVFQRIAEGIVTDSQIPCQFGIPAPPEGEEFDKDLVNVNYTPGDGSGLVLLDSFDSAADCGDSEGWHYDNPDAPTGIITCPQTCSRLANDEAAAVDVELGCARRIPVVR